MKKVLFVRHAKSDFGNDQLTDHDRPLNKSGIKDAEIMGGELKYNKIFPETFITSSANRAYTTCQIFKDKLKSRDKTIIESKIYNNGKKGVLDSIHSIDDKIKFIALFGHNPTMHEIANYISENPIYEFKTCSMILTSSSISKWIEYDFFNSKLLMYEYPRRTGSYID